MVVPVGGIDQCRQFIPPGFLHDHVQRFGMVRHPILPTQFPYPKGIFLPGYTPRLGHDKKSSLYNGFADWLCAQNSG